MLSTLFPRRLFQLEEVAPTGLQEEQEQEEITINNVKNRNQFVLLHAVRSAIRATTELLVTIIVPRVGLRLA